MRTWVCIDECHIFERFIYLFAWTNTLTHSEKQKTHKNVLREVIKLIYCSHFDFQSTCTAETHISLKHNYEANEKFVLFSWPIVNENRKTIKNASNCRQVQTDLNILLSTHSFGTNERKKGDKKTCERRTQNRKKLFMGL